jgi:hypothetical protein
MKRRIRIEAENPGFVTTLQMIFPTVGFQAPKAYDGKEGLPKIKMEQLYRVILSTGMESRFEC